MNIGKLQQFAKILAPEDNIMGNHPDFAQMVNDARLCIMVLRLLEQHIISGYSLIVGDNFSSLAADENVFLSSSLPSNPMEEVLSDHLLDVLRNTQPVLTIGTVLFEHAAAWGGILLPLYAQASTAKCLVRPDILYSYRKRQ